MIKKGSRSFKNENLRSVGQSQWPSNFENDLAPDKLQPGLIELAHNSGGMAEAADFFLRTPTLTASNFKAL